MMSMCRDSRNGTPTLESRWNIESRVNFGRLNRPLEQPRVAVRAAFSLTPLGSQIQTAFNDVSWRFGNKPCKGRAGAPMHAYAIKCWEGYECRPLVSRFVCGRALSLVRTEWPKRLCRPLVPQAVWCGSNDVISVLCQTRWTQKPVRWLVIVVMRRRCSTNTLLALFPFDFVSNQVTPADSLASSPVQQLRASDSLLVYPLP
eukprot:5239883-Amphidinium_carterae.3